MPQSAEQVFRDYATDGVAASGVHKPIKSEIRALITALESATDVNQPSAVANLAYRADLWTRRLQFNSAI